MRSVAWSRMRSRGPIATACAVSQLMPADRPRPAEPAPLRAPRPAPAAPLRAPSAPRRAAVAVPRLAVAVAAVTAVEARSATARSPLASRLVSGGPPDSDSSTATSAACARGGAPSAPRVIRRATVPSVMSVLSELDISVTCRPGSDAMRPRLPVSNATRTMSLGL